MSDDYHSLDKVPVQKNIYCSILYEHFIISETYIM